MTVVQIAEAGKLSPAQLTGKVWNIKIIEGDRQGSSAYYPKEVLEASKHLFKKGTKIYGDHPSMDEKWNRPERSYKDIVGWLTEDATFDGKDLFANAQFIESEQARIKELAEADVIGMSIRGEGQLVEGPNGMELAKFMTIHSVDVVTQAGAGGGFNKLLESARQVSAPESGAESQKKEEESVMDPKFEAALDALVESNKKVNIVLEAMAPAVATLVERADKEDKAKEDALLEAQKPKEVDPLEVAAKLAEAKLAGPAAARVLDAVKGGKELVEAIKAENDYRAAVLEEAGKNFSGHEQQEIVEGEKTLGATVFG